jgi:hypothetical protein
VDAYEVRASRAVVDELVRRSRRDDHDVARPGLQAFLAVLEGEIAVDDDPRLVVGMAVQARALTRLAVVED